MTQLPHLFSPYEHGSLKLAHRVAMAPLTRNRAKGTIPGELNAEYYAQRADAAILITEGTHPAAVGQGYLDIAGLHDDAQQAGWQKVIEAVRAAGDAKFVIQLMHCGRVAHPVYTDGETPVAPSAVKPDGQVFTPDGMVDFVEPRAIGTEELAEVREQYVSAARRAIAAGADGVELHAANGYLLHQFLADNTNVRTDGYGTDVAGRIRFVVETVDAVVAEIGAQRTAIRLSPGHTFNDMAETSTRETYAALLTELARHDLMYVHVMETAPYAGYSTLEQARELFPGHPDGQRGLHGGVRRGGRRRADRRRQGRPDRLRPALHRQPGPPAAPAHRRRAQRARRVDVLRRRREGLHGLPDARAARPGGVGGSAIERTSGGGVRDPTPQEDN